MFWTSKVWVGLVCLADLLHSPLSLHRRTWGVLLAHEDEVQPWAAAAECVHSPSCGSHSGERGDSQASDQLCRSCRRNAAPTLWTLSAAFHLWNSLRCHGAAHQEGAPASSMRDRPCAGSRRRWRCSEVPAIPGHNLEALEPGRGVKSHMAAISEKCIRMFIAVGTITQRWYKPEKVLQTLALHIKSHLAVLLPNVIACTAPVKGLDTPEQRWAVHSYIYPVLKGPICYILCILFVYFFLLMTCVLLFTKCSNSFKHDHFHIWTEQVWFFCYCI